MATKPVFFLDGSDMRGGDGKFMNHSCHPNVKVNPNYVTTLLSPVSTPAGSVRLTTIALIQPSRYAYGRSAAYYNATATSQRIESCCSITNVPRAF